jgi:hypothetical protein
VALGASNLTRGFQALVSGARERWGSDVEVLAALGHGRSYGSESRVLVRTLPGILQSGLWAELDRLPPAPTLGLITDVGNDILYGATAPRILSWVAECAERLQRHTREVVLTDLPLASVRRLSPARFVLFRTILFPRSRLTLAETIDIAEAVVAGIEALAVERHLRFFRLRSDWYGFDPIHIRPRHWRAAFQQMLGIDAASATSGRSSRLEGLRLYALRPERERLFGVERVRPPVGTKLGRGGRVWLF